MTPIKFQDDRAQPLSDISHSLTDGLYDKDLSHHLCYGGMHPLEAMARLEVQFAKADVARLYRRSLRRYQRSCQISGIEWKPIEYCGYSVEIPVINDQLSATRQDVKIMRNHKPVIIDFLNDVQKYFKLWLFDKSADKRNEYPWVEYPWDKAMRQLQILEWIDASFADRIYSVQPVKDIGSGILEYTGDSYDRPETSFSILGYFYPPTAQEDDPRWWQLNNDCPSC